MSVDSPVETSPFEPPPPASSFDAQAELAGPVYSGGGAARWTLAGLALCAGIDFVQILVVGLVRWSLAQDDHYDLDGDWTPPSWILDLDAFVSVAPLLALIATGIAFLIWFARAHEYASTRAPLSGSPVIVWFIPIASLWMPYQRVRDVWNVLVQRPLGLVQVWWGLWIAQGFVSRATSFEPDSLESLARLHFLMVVVALLHVITALLAARVVLTIDQAARGRVPASF